MDGASKRAFVEQWDNSIRAGDRTMSRMIFTIFGVCVLALVVSPATGIDRKGTVGGFATELQPADSCTMGEARRIMDRSDIKLLVTMPSTVNEMRFLGISRQNGNIVGASVAIVGCGLQVVTEVGMKRPWCEYLPFKAERCPTSFSRK